MTGHKPHASGRHGWRPPARRSPRSSFGRTARRTSTNPVSYTPTAATAVTWHFCPPTSLRGLLEPGARKRARPGSEGGPAQQCVGPTRPKQQGGRTSAAVARVLTRQDHPVFTESWPRDWTAALNCCVCDELSSCLPLLFQRRHDPEHDLVGRRQNGHITGHDGRVLPRPTITDKSEVGLFTRDHPVACPNKRLKEGDTASSWHMGMDVDCEYPHPGLGHKFGRDDLIFSPFDIQFEQIHVIVTKLIHDRPQRARRQHYCLSRRLEVHSGERSASDTGDIHRNVSINGPQCPRMYVKARLPDPMQILDRFRGRIKSVNLTTTGGDQTEIEAHVCAGADRVHDRVGSHLSEWNEPPAVTRANLDHSRPRLN